MLLLLCFYHLTKLYEVYKSEYEDSTEFLTRANIASCNKYQILLVGDLDQQEYFCQQKWPIRKSCGHLLSLSLPAGIYDVLTTY